MGESSPTYGTVDFCASDGYKSRFSSGQNLAYGGAKLTWNSTVNLWHSEVSKFTYGGTSNSGVGHYTQVVWSSSIKVGCGYAYCSASNTHYYVCNYSPAGNSVGAMPYKNGTSCQDCPSKCKNNLCDILMHKLSGNKEAKVTVI
uniref:Cysteine-rich secretory protein DIS2 n=1 Tax=Magallana gigas TaxID=29159 RepID=K1Q7H7_MAGGI